MADQATSCTAHKLTIRIKPAASINDLLKIYVTFRAQFNCIHISASWTSLGKMMKRSSTQRQCLHLQLAALEPFVQHTLRCLFTGEIGARAVANVAHGAAHCGRGFISPDLFETLAEAAKLKVTDFNAQDIANTAWAFAKAGQAEASLFAALAEAAKLKVSDFNAQGLANT